MLIVPRRQFERARKYHQLAFIGGDRRQLLSAVFAARVWPAAGEMQGDVIRVEACVVRAYRFAGPSAAAKPPPHSSHLSESRQRAGLTSARSRDTNTRSGISRAHTRDFHRRWRQRQRWRVYPLNRLTNERKKKSSKMT